MKELHPSMRNSPGRCVCVDAVGGLKQELEPLAAHHLAVALIHLAFFARQCVTPFTHASLRNLFFLPS